MEHGFKTRYPARCNVLAVGNPGSGKSTLLNGLIGTIKFPAGVSLGEGKTLDLVEASSSTERFIDTPGLSDVKNREHAANQITEGLKKGGNYKLLFVITLMSGRVQPVDQETVRKILFSLPPENRIYGLVINKLLPKEITLIEKETGFLQRYFPEAHSMYLFPKDMKLDDADDQMAAIPYGFQRWLKDLPKTNIDPNNVLSVSWSLEKLMNEWVNIAKRQQEKMAIELAKQTELKEKMKRDWERAEAERQAQIEALEKKNKRARAKNLWGKTVFKTTYYGQMYSNKPNTFDTKKLLEEQWPRHDPRSIFVTNITYDYGTREGNDCLNGLTFRFWNADLEESYSSDIYCGYEGFIGSSDVDFSQEEEYIKTVKVSYDFKGVCGMELGRHDLYFDDDYSDYETQMGDIYRKQPSSVISGKNLRVVGFYGAYKDHLQAIGFYYIRKSGY